MIFIPGLLQGDFGTSFRRHTPDLRDKSVWGTAYINARIWIDQELKKSLGY